MRNWRGQWFVDSCQWSVVSGQLSVVSGQWGVASGHVGGQVPFDDEGAPTGHSIVARGGGSEATGTPGICDGQGAPTGHSIVARGGGSQATGTPGICDGQGAPTGHSIVARGGGSEATGTPGICDGQGAPTGHSIVARGGGSESTGTPGKFEAFDRAHFGIGGPGAHVQPSAHTKGVPYRSQGWSARSKRNPWRAGGVHKPHRGRDIHRQFQFQRGGSVAPPAPSGLRMNVRWVQGFRCAPLLATIPHTVGAPQLSTVSELRPI